MEKIESCYSDLKICARGKRLNEVLETAHKLGYQRVAIDVEVEISSKKTSIPLAKELDTIIEQAVVPHGLRVLKRLTMCVNDSNLLHVAQGFGGLADYDLTAIRTRSGKVLQSCCTNINTDILALELGERLDFTVKRSQAVQVLDRGVVFEVCYTSSIKDQSIRRHVLSNTIELAVQTKGKGIMLSSGAEKSIELRGPLDIINYCHLFGLKTEQCKNCITKNCRQAILHSKYRREVVKGVVSCRPLTSTTDTQQERKRRHDEDSGDFIFDKKKI